MVPGHSGRAGRPPPAKLCRPTVYDPIRSRRLPSISIGRARRIPASALDRYIRRHLENAA
ncbi:helix-turn-helix domain-containing protein [Streptomyces cynarae]|uniref:helix-turn-helix domain-containing protein n=1 Tax=Streptomyces cynarae TaxID=2981134 RepID=UPI00406C101F